MATKTLEQQLSEAKARAMNAAIEIDTTASKPDGSLTIVTSEQKASDTYRVTRDAQGCLTCDCPARVVCKHIGLCLLTGIAYQAEPVDPMVEARAARLEAFRRVDAWLASVQDAQEAAWLADVARQNEAALAEERAIAVATAQLPVVLAGSQYREEEKLTALAYLPVALFSYGVIVAQGGNSPAQRQALQGIIYRAATKRSWRIVQEPRYW